jgi:hypothetical protein
MKAILHEQTKRKVNEEGRRYIEYQRKSAEIEVYLRYFD